VSLAKTGYRILRRDETDQSVLQEFYNQLATTPKPTLRALTRRACMPPWC
jgi:hypothetical protein